MIKKISIILLTLLIIAGLGVVGHYYITTPGQEGIAHLSTAKMELYSPLSTYSSSFATYDRSMPKELTDLPKELSANIDTLFFLLPVGKHNVFVIIQKPSDDTAVAWIDTNMDNRLSDEEALSSVPGKSGKGRFAWEYFDFGNIQLKGKNFTSVPFQFTCHKRGGRVQIHPINCMKGKIRLGNRIYQMAFVDGDFDGKIETVYSYSENYRYWGCDSLYFTEKRPSLPWNNNEFGQTIPFGKYFDCYHKYYSIDLSADGTTLHMRPVEPAMGTLKIGSQKGLRACLTSDTASQQVDFENQITLPAGKYQVHFGRLQYTDDTGRDWKLNPDFREDIRKGRFEIKEGQVFTLNPGPPFTVKCDISKKSNGKLSINVGLVGNEGEKYGLRLSRSMPEPTLKILDKNNDEVHVGTMEYG